MLRNGIVIEELDQGQWALLAVLRLASIRDAPGAFLLGVDEEGRGEAEWRAQFGPRSWFVAYLAGEPVGIVSSVLDEDFRYVESMWVRPAYRGHGIACELLRFLERSALAEGRDELRLYVLEGNPKTERFYTRVGFEKTGRGGLVGIVRRCQEREYRLPLPALTAGEGLVSLPLSAGR
jgi:ribosomal protein S18 acetylase RimI-like enzyme